MKDLQITPQMILNSDLIPKELIPKRYAIATNVIYIKKNGEGIAMMVRKDPSQTNSSWYPFFTSINSFYDFESSNFKSLLSIYYHEIINKLKVDTETLASKKFSEAFNCGIVTIENLQRNAFWLRYSPSVHVWTLYLFEYYIVTSITNTESINEELNDYCKFMELDKHTINEVVKNGVYKGTPVVENITDMLKDETILMRFYECAL